MLQIELLEEVSSPITSAKFRDHLHSIASEFLETDAMVEILVVGNERMRVLNREHRGKDSTTDVLSLPTAIDTEQGSVVPVSDAPRLLGTIVINVEQAARQVGKFGDTLDEEILELAAHSLRHLLGHDHDDEGEWVT